MTVKLKMFVEYEDMKINDETNRINNLPSDKWNLKKKKNVIIKIDKLKISNHPESSNRETKM